VARGPQLAAIRDKGLRLIEENGETFAVAPRAVESLGDVEGQDLVILGMKAHQVSAIASAVPGMLAPQGLVLTAQNGIPWWYFSKTGGAHERRSLESVDPGGEIARHLPLDRVIGSVVYPAA
jgi:2-dehydropantoate 2-reductase